MMSSRRRWKIWGIVVLQDESVNLEYNGASIQVIGLNDPDFTENDSSLSGAILESKLSQLYISDGFTLLLSHRPEYFKIYQKAGINLILSGHAHGGQVRLPFIGGIFAPNQGFFPKYDSGLYAENGTYMVVSRGLGNSIMPVRLNNRPEIVIEKLITATD
jgi:predicted MPP superfamily phosphohydrolase